MKYYTSLSSKDHVKVVGEEQGFVQAGQVKNTNQEKIK